ncbi:glycine oxidase ThiO [Sediminibacillus massiliensis]|uniref:glycine oxidase ThiO n=1 Tax=Sediminibacillus massiliensis TaxID=1926277 RepID=UPI0009884BF0|nr:glycine oxidase ThiO [Sediminibacillus massiliensis]
MRYDTIIVGGGVIGCSIAYRLAKRGQKVLVLEKDRIGSKASRAAAGMLGAQAELEEDGPLFQLARKSRELFLPLADEIKEDTGIDIELVNKGMYKVARSEEEVEEYTRVMDFQKKAGADVEWLTGENLRVLEPMLSESVLGAMYLEKDGQVSAPQLTEGLWKAAVAHGVEVKEFADVQSFLLGRESVDGVVTSEGKYLSENVVVAAGAWSGKLLEQAKLSIETYPVKGECFSVISPRPLLTATIFSHGCYLVPKKGGRLVVGATVHPRTFNQQITVGGISSLMEKAEKLLPAIKKAEWEMAWTGIRPQTEDGLPYLGEHPNCKGLFVAAGHYRNGILLSPITGIVMADLIERKDLNINLGPFRLNRRNPTLV